MGIVNGIFATLFFLSFRFPTFPERDRDIKAFLSASNSRQASLSAHLHVFGHFCPFFINRAGSVGFIPELRPFVRGFCFRVRVGRAKSFPLDRCWIWPIDCWSSLPWWRQLELFEKFGLSELKRLQNMNSLEKGCAEVVSECDSGSFNGSRWDFDFGKRFEFHLRCSCCSEKKECCQTWRRQLRIAGIE
jgi:hypothetical protein